MSTLKTTRSRSHIASVNIIPRIVDPTVVPTLDLDLGQPKPKPGPSPIMPFSSVYQLEKCDHITQSDTAQTLPNRNLHQLQVRLHVPATKFSSTTRNLPKTDDSLCRLPTVPEATIDHYSGQTTQQIIALGKLQVVKLNPITGTTQSNNLTLSRCKLWTVKKYMGYIDSRDAIAPFEPVNAREHAFNTAWPRHRFGPTDI